MHPSASDKKIIISLAPPEPPKRKKKGPKGPNPMSVKKKKAREPDSPIKVGEKRKREVGNLDTKDDTNPAAPREGEGRKRKRRKKAAVLSSQTQDVQTS